MTWWVGALRTVTAWGYGEGYAVGNWRKLSSGKQAALRAAL